MMGQGQDSRTRIIEAANRLIYTHGYNPASFAAIAEEVGITKGNLHYHFRSKEELLQAVVEFRRRAIQEMLREWQQTIEQPIERLHRFVQMLRNDEADLIRYGCPMGSLNMELGKGQLELQQHAVQMFEEFRLWLQQQFRLMQQADAKGLSMHLLSMAQGAALMAYIYHDKKILSSECKKIDDWIAQQA